MNKKANEHDIDYGSTSLINIKDSQMIETSMHELHEQSKTDLKLKKGNPSRISRKGSPHDE